MNSTNLTSVLNTHSNILGDNYTNLGKWIDSGYFKHKLFLSKDQKGWEVIKLNFLQLIFRNFFGLYKNTHLNHVFKHLSYEDFPQVQSLHSRVIKIWSDKYLQWVGNASLNKTDVICFAEEHGDRSYRAFVKQFINENYKKGDIILVEGVKSGEIINPMDCQLTQGLREDCLVLGWEPENFEKINHAAFELADAKYQELIGVLDKFESTFSQNYNFEQEKMELLEENLKEIGNKVLELNQFYQSKDPSVVNVHKIFSAILEHIKEKNFENAKDYILYGISKILQKLEKKQEKAFYKNLTPAARKLILENAPLRDLSLVHGIKKYREEGKRLWIIGGILHFLQTPYTPENKVKKELAQHQFLILATKDLIHRFARFNQDISPLHIPSHKE